ncbi:FAD-dependent thymidylate synthase [Desulfurobacterium atlanticum]|uniref:Thymidylate synthase complementing protein n=1 Tax=Desulfurobacterium atlanticum TaxID=240169 RepID=A0A238YNQ8_9BACT|nr:FAD-dependent thymidylate synthase [Desulfurobacterium atlanticum]SNR72660.1 Thymidylate synthase complementing protein [Desulfurobacterium atlanticum]
MIKLISSTEEILKTVSIAARVCYSGSSVDKLIEEFSEEENRKLIKKVTSMGHLSVVEHAVFTFSIPKQLKEELFEILKEKPFLNISEREEDFIVSLNLRTMKELQTLLPDLTFTKEVAKHIPDWLT